MDKYDEILKKYGVDNGGGNVFNPQASQENTVDTLKSAWSVTPEQPTKKGLFGSIAEDIKQRGVNVQDIEKRRSEGKSVLGEVLGLVAPKFAEKVSPTLETVQKTANATGAYNLDIAKTGQVAGIVGDTFMEVLGAITPEKWKEWGAEKIGQVLEQVGIDNVQKLNQFIEQNPMIAKNIEGAINIADVVPVAKGATAPVKALTKVAKQGAETVVDAGTTGATRIFKTLVPDITPEKALGEVLQGGTQDIKLGAKALASVDTSGVKTFADLNTVLKNKIPELAKVVDENLIKNSMEGDVTISKLLPELATKQVSKGGKEVVTNYVENALKDLTELYDTIGDGVKKSDIQDTIVKAQTEGLTRKEVNDIARVYNIEFGDKAFNKVGDPLTSVNAQRFENTRKGLKDVAREGITDPVAKQADETMSAIYNTKRLVERNVEAVNKLNQRIRERGLLESLGNKAVKIIDTLSGGAVRGVIGGLLPRGVGYKTFNAIDIEKLLSKNLETIQKAFGAKTGEEMGKIIEKDLGNIFDSAKKAGVNFTDTAKPEAKFYRNIDQVMADAPSAKQEIDSIADEISAKFAGTRVAKAPLKKPERISEKVAKELFGDFDEIKDVARNTIVSDEAGSSIPDIYKELEKYGAGNDAFKIKIQKPDSYMGYSGTIVNLRSKSGLVSEIQVNTPKMIYAKESAKDAKAILGEDLFNKMQAQYGEGGLGHTYYEQFRALPKSKKEGTIGQGIINNSKTYYSKFNQ